MDGGGQSLACNSSESRCGVLDRQRQLSCVEWQPLDCQSVQCTFDQECLLQGCYACSELANINEEISKTYIRLSDLVKERKQMMAKPRHSTLIHRMPVDILSTIFVAVKNAMIVAKFQEHPDRAGPRRPTPLYHQQPYQSPPLLVGAVCKRWRDITLITPQLWTDVIINLEKSPEGQSNMIKKWAHRAAALLLDISICQPYEMPPGYSKEKYGDVLLVVRSLADRWRDILLHVDRSVSYQALNNIQHWQAPHLRTLAMNMLNNTFELPHLLRPKHLISSFCHVHHMPCDWNHLVFLDVEDSYQDQILHVIRHAQNLQQLIVSVCEEKSRCFPLPSSPIINLSLVYLDIDCNILDYLTLPSLKHLEYDFSENPEPHVKSLIGFLARGCPSLSNFIIRYYSNRDASFPYPIFEKVPGITSLFLVDSILGTSPSTARLENFLQSLTQPQETSGTILPHLKTLYLGLPHLNISATSWSLLAHLFPHNAQTDPMESDDVIGSRRPLSEVKIYTRENRHWAAPKMCKDSFLRLLEVKKSGVNLELMDANLGNLVDFMAGVYKTELLCFR